MKIPGRRRAVAVLVASLIGGAAMAHEDKDGHALNITKCYSACSALAMEQKPFHWQEDPVQFCVSAQEKVFGLMDCRRSCRVQAVTLLGDADGGDSLVREALDRTIERVAKPLRHSGLWISYTETPTLSLPASEIGAFTSACAAHREWAEKISKEVECLHYESSRGWAVEECLEELN